MGVSPSGAVPICGCSIDRLAQCCGTAPVLRRENRGASGSRVRVPVTAPRGRRRHDGRDADDDEQFKTHGGADLHGNGLRLSTVCRLPSARLAEGRSDAKRTRGGGCAGWMRGPVPRIRGRGWGRVPWDRGEAARAAGSGRAYSSRRRYVLRAFIAWMISSV